MVDLSTESSLTWLWICLASAAWSFGDIFFIDPMRAVSFWSVSTRFSISLLAAFFLFCMAVCAATVVAVFGTGFTVSSLRADVPTTIGFTGVTTCVDAEDPYTPSCANAKPAVPNTNESATPAVIIIFLELLYIRLQINACNYHPLWKYHCGAWLSLMLCAAFVTSELSPSKATSIAAASRLIALSETSVGDVGRSDTEDDGD